MHSLFALIGSFFGAGIGSYLARRFVDMKQIIKMRARLEVLEEKFRKSHPHVTYFDEKYNY